MNLPNLPDGFHKFIILIGVFLLGVSYYNFEKKSNKISKLLDINEGKIETTSGKIKFLRSDIEHLKRSIEITSVQESWSLIEKLRKNQVEISILIESTDSSINKIKRLHTSIEENKQNLFLQVFFGATILSLGILFWIKIDERKNLILEYSLKEKEYDLNLKGILIKYCQSCGKSFGSNLKKGYERDKTINNSFCINCYQDGEFTEDISYEDFKLRVEQIIKQQKGFYKRNKLKNRFESLERWKQDEYF